MKVESNMLPLGTLAPNFELRDVVTNQMVALDNKTPYKATVVMFLCNHCPYVKHINTALTQLTKHYISKEIRFIAINANDVTRYPDDSPENMRVTAQMLQYPFPYLYDETQEVAKAYNAACTPDFFVFDTSQILVYRGQFDDSRPGNNKEINGSSISEALESLIFNQPVNTNQKPSLGCNIKWK